MEAIRTDKNNTWLSNWVLPGFILLSFGLNIIASPRNLWVQDESRYGTILREMTTHHSWLVPTVDGRFYPDKPPLYFWLASLQSHLTGMTELTLRLITFYSVIAFALAFFFFCRRILGHNKAIVATLVSLSSLLFLLIGNIVRMDMLMAFLVVVSIDAFHRGITKRKYFWILAGYLSAILAAFIKGPLGFAFPFLFAVTFTLIHTETDDGKNISLPPPVARLERLRHIHLFSGLGLTLALTTLWVFALVAQGQQQYLHNILYKQILGRSIGTWSHSEPLFFYALFLPLVFMPWTPFLYQGYRNATSETRKIAIAWFLPGFILISLIHGKLFIYLLPLLPPLALLVADGGIPLSFGNGIRHIRSETISSGLFFALLGCGITVASQIPKLRDFHFVLPIGILLLMAGIFICLNVVHKQCRTCFISILLMSCMISILLFGWSAQRINYLLSPKPIGIELARLHREGYQTVASNITYGIFGFYSGLQLHHVSNSELKSLLDSKKSFAIVIRNKRRKQIPSESMDRLIPEKTFPHPHRDGYTIYLSKGAAPNVPPKVSDSQ